MARLLASMLLGTTMTAVGAVSFRAEIAPLLRSQCQACHGAKEPKGDYRVDSYAELMKALEDEQPRVVAGHPNKSTLLALLTSDDAEERMPAKSEPLKENQIALVRQWIAEGAKFDGGNPKAELIRIIPAPRHREAPKTYPRPLPVTALAFSPQGDELAVSGLREVTVWNVKEGRLKRRIGNMAQRTFAVAWSPDGQWLAAGGGVAGELGEARVFDAVTGTLRAVAHRAGDVVLDARYDANGTLLAVGDADHRVAVYDTADFSSRLRVDNHADWVMALAWSPDGRYLASASRDRTAKLFDLKTGDVISTYGGHGVPVLGVAWKADGKQVFSSGRDRKIHVWEAGLADIDGKRFGAKKVGEISGFGERVFRILIHGNTLLSPSADGRARLHEAASRKLVRELPDHGDWVLCVAHNSSSGRLATGSHDGFVRVWDAKSGRMLKQFQASP